MADASKKQPYTCTDYRTEMILLALTRRLHQAHLTDKEKEEIEAEIDRMKALMGMD